MKYSNKKIESMFLSQSYKDAWNDYKKSLKDSNYIVWDYIILTASNEEQAKIYRKCLESRIKGNFLPQKTKFIVVADPNGERVGSGGATLNAMKKLVEMENTQNPKDDIFASKRILVIHSGGDSKRVPQYSATGKLFSPVPRLLPDGRGSTLFDEFIIAMSGVASRLSEGMLVLSGDVLILFNTLQIDTQCDGALAISVKAPSYVGKNHGVFLNDKNNIVRKFLHKFTEEELVAKGAVSNQGMVDLDTGAILLNKNLLCSLYDLISTGERIDVEKFNFFVSKEARVSFYGDFLYPLASDSSLEEYYKEKPDGEYTKELLRCRKQIWEKLSPYTLKSITLLPAQFIHFGTSKELLSLMTNEIQDYEYLSWQNNVLCNFEDMSNTYYCSKIASDIKNGNGNFIEYSNIGYNVAIGNNSIISNINLKNIELPGNIVLHKLVLNTGEFVVRIYGIEDNPKDILTKDTKFIDEFLYSVLEKYKIEEIDLFDDEDRSIWKAKLYTVCKNEEEAILAALDLYDIVKCKASIDKVKTWIASKRTSLFESYNEANVEQTLVEQEILRKNILIEKFIESLKVRSNWKLAIQVFGKQEIDDYIFAQLLGIAKNSQLSTAIRVLYTLALYMKDKERKFLEKSYSDIESMCFLRIREEIFSVISDKIINRSELKVERNIVEIELPLRVNFGGGWTDTPPYCIENGGLVLNAAVSLEGSLPVKVTIKKIDSLTVEFESQDIGAFASFEKLEDLQNCYNPYDSFALHKAALLANGIIPIDNNSKTLEEILRDIGGGFYISTQVINIPKGSGLGTSSILAAACTKAISQFFDLEYREKDIFDIVLCMEQLMSTGGGWQDQVGGVVKGFKLVSSSAGIHQDLNVKVVDLSEEIKKELKDRFVLVYTGQRRLARNLLRDIVGAYIASDEKSISTLKEIRETALLMTYYLENNMFDEFLNLLNRHWELSCQLDTGTTNTCIEYIYLHCKDLVDARFIAGAGGGGFLIFILKKGIKKEVLSKRLDNIFQDGLVRIWDSEFIF